VSEGISGGVVPAILLVEPDYSSVNDNRRERLAPVNERENP